ncbi:hypothetical protein H4S02_007830, partial [Coemansia sp. RSA 2611]
MPRLVIDSAYAALSIAALVLLLANASPRRALAEFGEKCELDITQARPPSSEILAYRDTLTIKYYSPMLWCRVSWMLATLLSNKWYMLGLANALVATVSLARKALIHYIFGRLTMNEVH